MRLVSLSTLLVLTLSPLASAAAHLDPQSVPTDAEVRGTVIDETRAGIPGAEVTAVVDGGTASVSTVTDLRGAYVLVLQPGRYSIRVKLDGFRNAERRITKAQASGPSIDFILQVAGVREAVTVTAASGYRVPVSTTATKTPTPLRDVPQSVTVVTQELIRDQMMMSVGDVMRYVPGVMVHQGENNRDQVIIRGNSSSADFFVDGVRDDVQYYRDLYNLERIETLKGPNAMIFGRGGAGGVVNRVTKSAGFTDDRGVSLQGGMFGNKRFTADINQPFGAKVAVRLNGMFEESDSFRDFVGLTRYGVAPTMTIVPSARTKVILRYEHLHDSRIADRGITSFQGRPADVDVATFYGNPSLSDVQATVNLVSGTIEHHAGRLALRNHTLIGDYARFYQNFVPGAVTADKSQVALSVYNNATDRTNVFNQSDATLVVSTGVIRHTLMAGTEFGRQLTDNVRNTGFFNNTATSVLVPYASPTISTPVTFRQNATDANNHLTTTVAAVYGQDQIELSRYVQVLAGLRFDRFDLTYHNNRSGDTLERPDDVVSPRAGIVFTPLTAVSLYSSYSVSYLPSSGDQFASLTTVTQQVKPEQFRNYEVGAKWDAAPGLAVTTAVYRLNRTNTRSIDPNDPTRIVQTGSQRTNGYEVGANGRITPQWSVAGGYSYQNAFVTSATIAAVAGAQVGQVPHHMLSLWNNYQIRPRIGAGLGLLYRSDMFATIDNTVTLPGYTRVDAAAFFALTRQVRVQLNVENLFDETYFINADSNTNISPGFPRTFRVGLTAGF